MSSIFLVPTIPFLLFDGAGITTPCRCKSVGGSNHPKSCRCITAVCRAASCGVQNLPAQTQSICWIRREATWFAASVVSLGFSNCSYSSLLLVHSKWPDAMSCSLQTTHGTQLVLCPGGLELCNNCCMQVQCLAPPQAQSNREYIVLSTDINCVTALYRSANKRQGAHLS